MSAIDSEWMREQVAKATAEGIQTAARDPLTWAAASEGLKLHATAEAGGWLLGGVRLMFSRLMWILVLGLAIYLVGGWSALVAFVKGSAP